ncbi:hypothetical protein D1159_04910 [Pseudoflavonifractor sp. 524-17]|uniref:DUF3592 domain-containing protein n=1 Tax=Pseudoflavonifractor sp. 524-17 TaxID=2304577 RepID=UPI00137A6CAA|nr:DUF3592 domain-containing protein [Pseudoflavonifractor sp. 524-17]NCE63940.1 hypothetical protein [Pseudoflavonifractor sp. 524-17]
MNRQRASKTGALRRWRFFAVLWPLLCLCFAVIVVCQPGRSLDQRIGGTALALFPLIFFAAGMSLCRRLLAERGTATVRTTAVVIARGRRTHMGRSAYFPEFEFRVGEIACRVTSSSGSSCCLVKEGGQVDLYYDPEHPKRFYVPVLWRYNRRFVRLLCGTGIVLPLLGLFAPQLRALAAALP